MLVAVLALATVATGAIVATLPSTRADAANAADFNPGYLISDQTFYNGTALSAAQAQSFVVSQGAGCSNNGSIPCLKNLSVSSPAIAATAQCTSIVARTGMNAGTVFATVGAACGVNPEVLITLVEKEQTLVSTTKPSAWMYEEAAGFACPDTAPCSETYSGFFNQIYAAARQFQLYRQYPSSFNYQAGRVNNIQYSPTASCGTEAVYIQNQATAGLYDYTPYVPNAAALANLYGTGNSCSAYGNRNFWRIFTDWFGNPTASMLTCPSFDGCTTGWEFLGSMDRAVYGGTGAQSGTSYLALVPHAAGAAMDQRVNRTVTVGDQYQATIWVKAAVAGQTVNGRAAIWGLGGSGNENSVQSFSVGSTWTQVTVTFQAAQLSHSQLMFELYLDSPNLHVSVDDASLKQVTAQPAKTTVPLQSPSFENGQTAWPTATGFVNRVVYTGSGAEDGKSFFATNTAVAGNAFGQRVSWPISTATAYTARIWLRSATPGKSFSGRLALWAVGSSNTNAVTSFNVGNTWTQVQVTLPANTQGQSQFIFEVYEDTVGATLYADNASLTTNQLANGSLEQGSTGWSPYESGTNLGVLSSSAATGYIDASHIGATNVSTSNGSIQTSVTRQVWKGQTFTATIWIRAANTGGTFKGTFALWELGPNGNSSSSVPISVGNQWHQYTVSHVVQSSSATSVKLQLYESSVGITADFDGATLN